MLGIHRLHAVYGWYVISERYLRSLMEWTQLVLYSIISQFACLCKHLQFNQFGAIYYIRESTYLTQVTFVSAAISNQPKCNVSPSSAAIGNNLPTPIKVFNKILNLVCMHVINFPL